MQAGRKRVLIVGGGKMGTAVMRGWIASARPPADGLDASSFTVVEPASERRAFLEREYSVDCVCDTACLRDAFDLVVLAVKPQAMAEVLEELSDCAAFQGTGSLFVSIAAGLTTASIAAGLPSGSAVVRVMPNMPLAVGAGASGVCAGANASAEQASYVAELFGCLGRAVVVDESDMDVVCALSGSGPAYVVAMIEALRDAAAHAGLDAPLAEALALQTVLGTARLIDETGSSLEDTRCSICSPGGTTVAALDAMDEAGFAHVFDVGVKAAVARSKELAQCT